MYTENTLIRQIKGQILEIGDRVTLFSPFEYDPSENSIIEYIF